MGEKKDPPACGGGGGGGDTGSTVCWCGTNDLAPERCFPVASRRCRHRGGEVRGDDDGRWTVCWSSGSSLVRSPVGERRLTLRALRQLSRRGWRWLRNLIHRRGSEPVDSNGRIAVGRGWRWCRSTHGSGSGSVGANHAGRGTCRRRLGCIGRRDWLRARPRWICWICWACCE